MRAQRASCRRLPPPAGFEMQKRAPSRTVHPRVLQDLPTSHCRFSTPASVAGCRAPLLYSSRSAPC